MDWTLFVEMAKTDEKVARAKYLEAAKSTEVKAIKDMFNKLAYEEEIHLAILEKFEDDLATLLADK